MSENNQKMAPASGSRRKNGGFCGPLTGVKAVEKGEEGHIVWLTFEENIKGKLIFLEETIFRYDVDPSGAFVELCGSEREGAYSKDSAVSGRVRFLYKTGSRNLRGKSDDQSLLWKDKSKF